MFHLIFKSHSFFTHLWLGGIRLLLVLCHTCCLFVFANSFSIAFCCFGQGLGFFWYRLGVFVHHSQINEKIWIFDGTLFFCFFDNFVGIIIIQSLELFHCSYHFCVGSGLEGDFDLVIYVFIKKVVIVVFKVLFAQVTVGITNYIYIITINYYRNWRFVNLGTLTLGLL